MATLVHLYPATRVAWALDPQPATPDGHRQSHMWNILRGPQARGGISAEQLALFASTEALPIDDRQAGAYLDALLNREVVKREVSSYRVASEHRRQVFAPRLLQVQFLYVQGRKLGVSMVEAVEAAL